MSVTLDKDSVTAILGLATLAIALSQMKIASAKTKLDLYNKRFAIYIASLDYYHALLNESNAAAKEKSIAQSKGYREALFLFNKKDEIYTTLSEIEGKGASARSYAEQIANLEGSQAASELASLQEKRKGVLGDIGQLIDKLEKQLEPYLRFKAASGWFFWR
ncbi:hypothetical protein QEG29_001173 [Stenotrophomonas maltophilia]|nr:hypothetical protein [Stenotrophomonas maltophilia]